MMRKMIDVPPVRFTAEPVQSDSGRWYVKVTLQSGATLNGKDTFATKEEAELAILGLGRVEFSVGTIK
jgi:hypothetical protein